MGRKLRHLLIFLLIMMKEPNMPEADCTGVSSPVCTYRRRGLTSMEQVDIPTSVCHLELGSNRISSITSLLNLTNLTYLDLGRNLLTNIQQSTFSNQPKLCFLDLAANKIRSIQVGAFSKQIKLQFLYLNSNQLTHIPPGVFVNLPELQHLHLCCNKIGEIESEVFSNLTKLQVLILEENMIAMVQAAALSNLPNLKILNLGKNRITKILSGTFSNLPNLQNLNLQTNQISSFPLSEYNVFASIQMLHIGDNPWQCDCRMVPFKIIAFIPLFINELICDKPPNLFRQKFKNVHPKDLICEDQEKSTKADKHAPYTSSTVPTSPPSGNTASNNGLTAHTVSSKFANQSDDTQWPSAIDYNNSHDSHHYQWYFRRNVGSIFGTDDTRRKVSMGVTPPPVTNTRHESGASVNQVVIISTAIGSLVTVTVAIAFIIWCKRSGKNLLTGIRNTKFAITNPIDTVMTNGQAGQGQSQANTNTTAMAEVSGHDNQYEDVDNQHNLKRQVRPHAITETKINTVENAASGQYEDMNQHNKKGQDPSQPVLTKSNTKAKAVDVASDHDSQYEDMTKHNQTGQGQSQAIAESNTNTTAAAMTSGHDLTEPCQYQNITESNKIPNAAVMTSDDQAHHVEQALGLDARNASYGTGPIPLNVNSLYRSVGQYQNITEPNKNSNAAVMTSDDDQAYRLGQAQILSESLDARNASYGTQPIPSNVNSVYGSVGPYEDITKPNTNTTAAEKITSGQD